MRGKTGTSKSHAPTVSQWDRYVSRFAADDTIKAIFDHLRNLGICAAVGAASHWRYVNAGPWPFMSLDYAISGVLAALAVWLFLINQSNMVRRLYDAGVSRNGIFAFRQLYTLLAVSIVLSLLAARGK